MKISVYILEARNPVTNDFLYTVGIFCNETVCYELIDKIKPLPEAAGIAFVIKYFTLNTPKRFVNHVTEAQSAVPAYIIEAIKQQAATQEIKAAADTIMQQSINKILKEVSDCIDNPEVLKEYIQGLRDGVEDYL